MGIARWALWLKASSEACEMTSKGAMSALRLQSMSFNGHIQQNRTECSATHLERNRQISFNHQGFNDSAIPTESRNLLGCPASAALRHFACNSAHGATVAADPASKHGWATLQLHHLWHHGWHQFDIQIRTIHLTSIIIFWADQFYCWTSIGISTVRPSTPWSLPRISAPKRAAEASPVSELAPASSPLNSNTDSKSSKIEVSVGVVWFEISAGPNFWNLQHLHITRVLVDMVLTLLRSKELMQFHVIPTFGSTSVGLLKSWKPCIKSWNPYPSIPIA